MIKTRTDVIRKHARSTWPYEPKNIRNGQYTNIGEREIPVVEALKENKVGKAIEIAKKKKITPARFGELVANGLLWEDFNGREWTYLYDNIISINWIQNPEIGHVHGKNLLSTEELKKLDVKRRTKHSSKFI